MKKNNTWNIVCLVNESFVSANQQTSVFYCRLSDFQSFRPFLPFPPPSYHNFQSLPFIKTQPYSIRQRTGPCISLICSHKKNFRVRLWYCHKIVIAFLTFSLLICTLNRCFFQFLGQHRKSGLSEQTLIPQINYQGADQMDS